MQAFRPLHDRPCCPNATIPMPLARIPRTADRPKTVRNFRQRAQHLVFIRQLSCTACGRAPPSEAAHVRSGTDGGAGVKPSDRFSVPLCTECHALQHQFGELRFWSTLRIDPLNVAFGLWTVSGNLAAGERIIFRAGQRIALVKHKLGAPDSSLL